MTYIEELKLKKELAQAYSKRTLDSSGIERLHQSIAAAMS